MRILELHVRHETCAAIKTFAQHYNTPLPMQSCQRLIRCQSDMHGACTASSDEVAASCKAVAKKQVATNNFRYVGTRCGVDMNFDVESSHNLERIVAWVILGAERESRRVNPIWGEVRASRRRNKFGREYGLRRRELYCA
jgi:hypothetical protein